MESIFTREGDGTWLPQEYARGPFDGLQGGALSALMCAAAEAEFPLDMATVALDVHFLKPCPLAPLGVAVQPIQRGARLAVLQVELSAGDKVRACATVTAMRAVRIDALPELEREGHRPWEGRPRPAPVVHGKPWLMDRMEARAADDGTPWFKFDTAVTGEESAFARALCAADCCPA